MWIQTTPTHSLCLSLFPGGKAVHCPKQTVIIVMMQLEEQVVLYQAKAIQLREDIDSLWGRLEVPQEERDQFNGANPGYTAKIISNVSDISHEMYTYTDGWPWGVWKWSICLVLRLRLDKKVLELRLLKSSSKGSLFNSLRNFFPKSVLFVCCWVCITFLLCIRRRQSKQLFY